MKGGIQISLFSAGLFFGTAMGQGDPLLEEIQREIRENSEIQQLKSELTGVNAGVIKVPATSPPPAQSQLRQRIMVGTPQAAPPSQADLAAAAILNEIQQEIQGNSEVQALRSQLTEVNSFGSPEPQPEPEPFPPAQQQQVPMPSYDRPVSLPRISAAESESSSEGQTVLSSPAMPEQVIAESPQLPLPESDVPPPPVFPELADEGVTPPPTPVSAPSIVAQAEDVVPVVRPSAPVEATPQQQSPPDELPRHERTPDEAVQMTQADVPPAPVTLPEELSPEQRKGFIGRLLTKNNPPEEQPTPFTSEPNAMPTEIAEVGTSASPGARDSGALPSPRVPAEEAVDPPMQESELPPLLVPINLNWLGGEQGAE